MEKLGRGRLIERRQVYSGKIVDLIVDRIELEGESYLREVVGHPGGVVVLGQLDDGRIPFVRQWRYPINKELLELPAGKIDPGEEPEATAIREMEEETGFRPRTIECVYSFYSSPGFCDELLHCFFSRELEKTAIRREKDEHIVTEFLSLGEALSLAAQGGILDAKTLVALLWLDRKLRV
ncbi:MAG: NUDIX hydrolase [Acidobacteriota bacterium]